MSLYWFLPALIYLSPASFTVSTKINPEEYHLIQLASNGLQIQQRQIISHSRRTSQFQRSVFLLVNIDISNQFIHVSLRYTFDYYLVMTPLLRSFAIDTSMTHHSISSGLHPIQGFSFVFSVLSSFPSNVCFISNFSRF